jgi:hypothetical protein
MFYNWHFKRQACIEISWHRLIYYTVCMLSVAWCAVFRMNRLRWFVVLLSSGVMFVVLLYNISSGGFEFVPSLWQCCMCQYRNNYPHEDGSREASCNGAPQVKQQHQSNCAVLGMRLLGDVMNSVEMAVITGNVNTVSCNKLFLYEILVNLCA